MQRDPNYGHLESNPVTTSLQDEFLGTQLPWYSHEDVAEVVRLRLLTDPGFPAWDVSYCWGRLEDGTPCNVYLPTNQLEKGRLGDRTRGPIPHLARLGVDVRRLGLLRPDVVSRLA